MSSLSVPELKELIASDPELTLVDVRTSGEVADGRIPGAVWMDMSDRGFIAKVSALSKEKTYCFYCASGGRTMMLVPMLRANGFLHAHDLDGGIIAWLSEGEAVA